jgi:hypothetical protein
MIYLFIASAVSIAIAVGDFLDSWLNAEGKRDIVRRFESWWKSVASLSKFDFAVALAKKVNGAVDGYLGFDLLSWSAYRKVALFSSMFLYLSVCALIAGGRFNERMTPWAEYAQGIGMMRSNNDQALKEHPKDEITKGVLAGQIRRWEIARHFQGMGWEIAFSFVFVLAAFSLTAVLGLLSVSLGRVATREIVETKRSLGAMFIVIGNGWSVTFLSTAVMILVGALSSPFTFFLIPSFFIILVSSPMLAWVMFATAGTAIWGLSNGPLKLVVAVGMFPWLASLVLVASTALNLRYRERLHQMTLKFLERCVANGPLRVLCSIAGLASALAAGAYGLVDYFHK